jgi:hypothetical protein
MQRSRCGMAARDPLQTYRCSSSWSAAGLKTDYPFSDDHRPPYSPDYTVFGSMVVGSFLPGGLLNSFGWEIVCLISFAPLLLAALALWSTGALRSRPAVP